MSYNTKQKDIIIKAIKNTNVEFTIKDIYNILNNKVGLTTIYRLIDKLVKDGLINKSISNNNVTYYRYLEECHNDNHFYLKCESCGNMFHIDCECINEIKEHILKEHNFSLSNNHTIINGICKNCRGK